MLKGFCLIPIAASLSSVMSSSQASVCHNSRPSPARKHHNLITSPADSRRTVQRQDDDSQSESSVYQPTPTTSTKRKCTNCTKDKASSEEEASPQPPQCCRKIPRTTTSATKKCSKRSKQPTKPSDGDANIQAQGGVKLTIDLVQDSEDENKKVEKKPAKPRLFNPIREYFEPVITIINF
ncbi:uncharacterized protein MELLADRAFT_92753 [Melampsora larici-populina 98AG31]|uniref:Secreted protein n=1 Tax=Melampsora larici-populina (strain 98AG31 / pathotype 3-4-7) TaxID=747676 RepID=F4S2L9_MELLP|nr:uncharacterized protein MELLADRAFT_92753 [Melampsora larici-populina 98AG31]EGG01108.1 hypothetical protein MELLADRAFT_92753 [Melampsora larici-populina 98AG31]